MRARNEGHTATHTATRLAGWQAASQDTFGGLAVCPSIPLYIRDIYSAKGGGLLGALTPGSGALPLAARAPRQTATGVAGVAT